MSLPLSHPPGASHTSNTLANGKELSRLITAAVVNREFCNLLLDNAAIALATGYNGESFQLATEEHELILSIRATSLTDFARQLAKNGNGNGHSHNSNGNRRGHNGHSSRFEIKACGHE